MFDLLKLTRPLNLLIIAGTMLLMRYGVIAGNLQRGQQELVTQLNVDPAMMHVLKIGPQMPLWLFLLLVLSTVLIAAAGNIINDYFDIRIDRVNKPDEVIVGRSVKRRVAMTAHLLLSSIGLLIGAFVAWRSGALSLIIIPIFAIASLWIYSTHLKKRLMSGNILIAVLTALVPLTVGLYEIPLLERNFSERPVVQLADGQNFTPTFEVLWYWILAYSAFAFLSTLIRELQKDMADVRGDLAGGCRTIPIVWGMTWARAISLFHLGMLILSLVALRMVFPGDNITYWYIGICVIFPLLLAAGFTYQAHNRSEFVRAGQMTKLAMAMAVGYSLMIPYLS
jgi:4-hydroxybenzoate polyprenyltransferase